MRDYIRKPRNWVVTIIIVSMLFAAIYTLFTSSKTNLPQYTGPEEVTEPVDEPKILDIPYGTFQAEGINLTMVVPDEWTYVVQAGCPTYINKVDGAKISFSISDYIPAVNNNTEQSLYNEVIGAGGYWGGYNRLDYSSYLLVYELNQTDFFELTTWDLNTTVRVQFAIPAARYEYYYDTVIYLFDSFKWEKEKPLPDNFFLCYNDYGCFEFGVPAGWVASIDNSMYAATNPNTGSIMYVTVYESQGDFSSISQIDYVAAASQNKSNYLLSTYANNGNTIVAEASYSSGGKQYSMIHNMLYNNGFVYEFTFECANENYTSDGAQYMTAVQLFRIF